MSPLRLNNKYWQTQDLNRECNHSCKILNFPRTCNLVFLLALQLSFLPLYIDFFSVYFSLCVTLCGYIYIFMNSTWSSPLIPEFTALFSTAWKGEKWWEMLKSKEGEDEHVLWALCCLILYQLSSLSPSERLNHKRIQSQGDILFSPSLNTLYRILDPHNVLSSCICNSRKQ